MCERSILAGLENPLPHGLDDRTALKGKVAQVGEINPTLITPEPGSTDHNCTFDQSATELNKVYQPEIGSPVSPQVGGVGDLTEPGEGVVLFVL